MSTATVLIAEDSENDIFLLRGALIKANLTNPIDFVHNGQQAIEYFRSDRNMNAFPELVLLDLKIRKPDGFEVLSWIRQQPHLKRMVVVYTTSDLTEDINRAYDLGANSFLIKPIDREVLTNLLKDTFRYWLDLNRRGDCGPRK